MAHEKINTPPQEVLVLPTEREGVVLRRLTPADAPAYFDAWQASIDDIAEYDPDTRDKYNSLRDVEESMTATNRLRMGILDNGKFVGSASIRPSAINGAVEIGYWVDSRQTGNGYASLAAKSISAYAAAHYPKVVAEVMEENERSVHILEKTGFGRTQLTLGEFAVFLPTDKTPEIPRIQVDQFFVLLSSRLTSVPELAPALELATRDPEYAYGVYSQYTAIVKQMSRLGDTDTQHIQQSWNRLLGMRGDAGSASKTNAVDIINDLGNDGLALLVDGAAESVDQQSEYLDTAVEEFVCRTAGGHKMFNEGRKPVDGDPESDSIIWGHTQMDDPEALLHFTVSHYLERYFALVLDGRVEAAEHKDFFINAMGDVLLLDHFGANNFSDIFDEWKKPRDEGSLGWIKADRINAFALSSTE